MRLGPALAADQDERHCEWLELVKKIKATEDGAAIIVGKAPALAVVPLRLGLQAHRVVAAADRGVTYHKVIYWVKQSNFWPYRAEFYSLSNRLLKTARYENFQTMLGKPRPTRLVMEDALRKGEESVLDYSAMKLRDLPDKVFTKDYLNKLE